MTDFPAPESRAELSPPVPAAPVPTKSPLNRAARWLFAGVFIIAGTLHFLIPAPYLRIMPPQLPHPLVLIWISGAAEIAGGLGLLIRHLRKAAAWGLIALLVAVSPANIYMAVAHLPFRGVFGQSWFQWLRVPLQLPLIAWAWLYTREKYETRDQPDGRK